MLYSIAPFVNPFIVRIPVALTYYIGGYELELGQ
jgi:hypothetical protein